MDKLIKPLRTINRSFTVPGDKSVTHRAVMFNAAAEGESVITGGLLGEDCLSTIRCMRALGAEIELEGGDIKIKGRAGRFKSGEVLDCGNSGTTMRLLAGLLAGAGVSASLTGDDSLSRRPMKRVTEPLRSMGADITDTEGHAPLIIRPARLRGKVLENTAGSAQVKSAILLAGLNAEGQTIVRERVPSRNHTELMLEAMGAKIRTEKGVVTVEKSQLCSRNTEVPADISSAAFLWAAGAVLKEGQVTVKNTGVNPTRDGILRVLRAMGADVRAENRRSVCGEAVMDITVKSSKLRATEVGGDIIPTLIDELPVIAVLACFAEGRTVIKDAAELSVKETDRIRAVAENLSLMGADITARADGWVIEGKGELEGGAELSSFGDHRIAMAMAVAALASRRGARISGAECVSISFPNFWECIEQ